MDSAFINNLLDRRTIRKYSSRDVDDVLLHRLIQIACRTQTMGNLQLYSIVVTRDEKAKKKLLPCHFCQTMITDAPVVLTICADFHRTVRWAEERRAEPHYDNLLSFMNATTDALLMTQTFCNVAESEGLGICFLGTTIYQPLQIIETLALPRLVFPVATLSVGWPAEQPNQTDRLPIKAVIHSEKYHEYSRADIDGFYIQKEQLDENKHYVEINNKETLAQVFTDIRYTLQGNQAGSRALKEALKRQGFI